MLRACLIADASRCWCGEHTPGQTPRHDLAALGHELPEQPVIFVVDVGDLLGAELANFLAPEKLASTFARRTARPGTSTTATAAKSRTVSPSERGPSPDGRDGRSATGAAALVSSVITLLLRISGQ